MEWLSDFCSCVFKAGRQAKYCEHKGPFWQSGTTVASGFATFCSCQTTLAEEFYGMVECDIAPSKESTYAVLCGVGGPLAGRVSALHVAFNL